MLKKLLEVKNYSDVVKILNVNLQSNKISNEQMNILSIALLNMVCIYSFLFHD
jgi:hypothetical protein